MNVPNAIFSVTGTTNPESLLIKKNKKNLNEIQKKYYFLKLHRSLSYPAARRAISKRVRQRENDYPLHCQKELHSFASLIF